MIPVSTIGEGSAAAQERVLGSNPDPRQCFVICLDFDGVLHNYDGVWRGHSKITGRPVPGAMGALVDYVQTPELSVCIYSARSRSFFGRRAMKRWLGMHLRAYYLGLFAVRYQRMHPEDRDTERCMPTEHDVQSASLLADNVLLKLAFPWFKPAAHVTVDDRALRFNGDWRAVSPVTLMRFTPWNRPRRNNAWDTVEPG